MPLPTVDDLKRHLRIRHGMEDADLQMKLHVAIDQAAEYLDRDIPWLAEEQPTEGGPVLEDVPFSVQAAILLLAEVHYRGHDEPCKDKETAAFRLLWPFRTGQGV